MEKFGGIQTGVSKMRKRAFRQLFSNEKVKSKSASEKIIIITINFYSRIILIAYKTTATITGLKQTAKQ